MERKCERKLKTVTQKEPKGESMPPTIRDVAREAGVSVATVSRVINGSEAVSDEIKDRVLKAINLLNYQPNLSARFLSQKKHPFSDDTKYVGVLFGEYVHSDHYFFSSVISGIEKTMFEKRLNVVISSVSQRDNYTPLDLPLFIAEKSLKYLIVIGETDPKFLFYLKENGFIVVMVDDIGPIGFDCVLCDYKRGALEAVEYLINLGHKNIGLIAGAEHHYFSRALENSYLKVLQSHDIPIRREYIVYNEDFNVDGGARSMEKLFLLSNPPTAILTNDEMAIGVLQKANEMNISIPDRLSVMGFDDIEMARFFHPPLTTMKIPGSEMGRLAAKLVIDKMQENEPLPAQRIELSPILVERKSCISLK